MITFPLWLKIYLVLSFIVIIWQTYGLLSINKYIASIKHLPDKQKNDKIKENYRAFKILKIIFWHTPIYLVVIPYILYDKPKLLFQYSVMIIIIYIIAIECFVCKKSVLAYFNKRYKLEK